MPISASLFAARLVLAAIVSPGDAIGPLPTTDSARFVAGIEIIGRERHRARELELLARRTTCLESMGNTE